MLLSGEMLPRLLSGTILAKQLDDAPSHLRRHRCAARHGFAHTLQQTCGSRLLQQIPRGACAYGLKDSLVIFINCEHEKDEVREAILEDSDALDAGHARKSDVDQRNIWGIVADCVQSLLNRLITMAAGEALGTVDQIGEPVTKFGLIFDYGDADDAGFEF